MQKKIPNNPLAAETLAKLRKSISGG